MRLGLNGYDEYGPNMTEAQFNEGVAQVVDELAKAEFEGKKVTQIRDDGGS